MPPKSPAKVRLCCHINYLKNSVFRGFWIFELWIRDCISRLQKTIQSYFFKKSQTKPTTKTQIHLWVNTGEQTTTPQLGVKKATAEQHAQEVWHSTSTGWEEERWRQSALSGTAPCSLLSLPTPLCNDWGNAVEILFMSTDCDAVKLLSMNLFILFMRQRD